ncbi:MAG: mechanosensitive ion channel family protein, partial [Lachnoclostridium sp.]|nr:mechanosensitive ion channel family protein [Lachnoclostridium sp.]
FIQDFEKNTVILGMRVWVDTEQYWDLRCQLMDEIKETLDANDIAISDEFMKVEVIPNQESK